MVVASLDLGDVLQDIWTVPVQGPPTTRWARRSED